MSMMTLRIILLQFNTLGTIFDVFYPKEFHRRIAARLPQGFYDTCDTPRDLGGMRIAARVDGTSIIR